MLGILTTDNQIKANIPSKDVSKFAQTKYQFFLKEDAPEISNRCCNVMKKEPAHRFEKESGLKPYIATTCSESMLRTQKWLQEGCNAFYSTNPHSKPLSFWTEQDILLYIKLKGLDIASVYGDIVEDISGTEEVEGQLTFSDCEICKDLELFDAARPPLKTTGCSRTGCIFCGFGCHLEKPGEGRFEKLKETHPKQYDYIMRPESEGGLNYKEIIDWINNNSDGNVHINY